MKKVYVLTLLCAIVVASCKKDYTCSCTVFGLTADTVLVDLSKADAEEYCDDLSSDAAIFGGSCELK